MTTDSSSDSLSGSCSPPAFASAAAESPAPRSMMDFTTLPEGPPVRVLLVEDSPVALALLKRALARHPRVVVVGTATQGEEALRLIPELDPQVICTDLHMPVMDGLAFTRAVMERFPRPILVVSISVQESDEQNIFQLFEAGAMDVFPKPMASWMDEKGGVFGAELAAKIITLGNVYEFSPAMRGRLGGERGAPSAHLPREPAPAVNLVVIGGSVGGPQAVREILAGLPVDFPAPILCVQQLEETFQPQLLEWLRQQTPMPVQLATHGEAPMAGSVYFPPRDRHLTLDPQGRLQVTQGPEVEGQRPSITVTMEAAASLMGGAAVGVLLSGVGRDGVRGLEAIAQVGGVTLVQDEGSSMSFETPRMAIELGAARYILPCEAIAQALLTLTGRGAGAATQPLQAGELPRPTRPEPLLIVEDSPTQALKLRRCLEGAGFGVRAAKDGQEGLEMAQQFRPRLIVSDVSMPRMDGFRMCRAIKRDPALRDTPVILLTALTNPAEILSGMGAGADNYLTKPYDEDYLLARVEELLAPPETRHQEGEEADGLEIAFEGQHFHIDSSRRQILNLLLSTYQRAVQQNRELMENQLQMKMLNLQLVDQTARQEVLNQQLVMEIAGRRAMEEKQARLLQELQTVNRELGNFAYIVSHDLRSPVRAIGSLTHWLQHDYADKLGEEGLELVGMLAGRAERMDTLIAAIQEYVSLSRVGEKLAPVNLRELLGEVVRSLELPETLEVLAPSTLPTITADRAKVEMIFRHLLQNAVRFMDKSHGEVRVEWGENGSWWHFAVADNGPGIDPQYHDKIFQVFQTLQPRDQLETSGMGLAMVKKAVEKYGGVIQVESAPGWGSTFRFTLPKEPAPLPAE